MSYEFFGQLALVAFVAAAVSFIVAVTLFFVLNIPEAVAILSGRRAARGVADIIARAKIGKGPKRGAPPDRAWQASQSADAVAVQADNPGDIASAPPAADAEALMGPTGTTLIGSAPGQDQEG
ncbi:MAG: hypothetical protein LBR32_09780 [Propionibacteriaceae bacterium]|jgi:hypothetical protein|nr:hypothetical protein [Propionibacteriaceae bacterium]